MVTAKDVRGLIVTDTDRASQLMTDNNKGYKRMGEEFAAQSPVSHSSPPEFAEPPRRTGERRERWTR